MLPRSSGLEAGAHRWGTRYRAEGEAGLRLLRVTTQLPAADPARLERRVMTSDT